MVLQPVPDRYPHYSGCSIALLLILVIFLLYLAGCAEQAHPPAWPVSPQDTTHPMTSRAVTETTVAKTTHTPVSLAVTPVPTDLLSVDNGPFAITQRESFFIHGIASGSPSGIGIWIIGHAFNAHTIIPVNPDGSFFLPISATDGFYSGQYFIIIQHPGINNRFDIDTVQGQIPGEKWVIKKNTDQNLVPDHLFLLEGPGSITGYDAAESVIKAINAKDSDDVCEIIQLYIEKPWITINPIINKHKGDRINFSSITNLQPGTEITYGVSETPYSPRRFEIAIICSGTAVVTAGADGLNNLFYECNTSEVSPHEYDIYEGTDDGSIDNFTQFYLLPPVDAAGNLVATRPKNYIAWDRLGLPTLIVNTSMQPVLPASDPYSNSSESWPPASGRIRVYSPEGVVRIFDKNGIQIAVYYDVGGRGGAVPSGATVSLNNGTNVSTVYYQGERYLTEIYE
jgi:hypothetical protein